MRGSGDGFYLHLIEVKVLFRLRLLQIVIGWIFMPMMIVLVWLPSWGWMDKREWSCISDLSWVFCSVLIALFMEVLLIVHILQRLLMVLLRMVSVNCHLFCWWLLIYWCYDYSAADFVYEPCYYVLTIMTQPQLYRFGQSMVDLPIGISVVSACGIVVRSVRFIKSVGGIIESSKLLSQSKDCWLSFFLCCFNL